MRLWLDRGQIRLTPDAVDHGFDPGLEVGDQLPAGIDQRLLGCDFGDDGALGFLRRDGNFSCKQLRPVDFRNAGSFVVASNTFVEGIRQHVDRKEVNLYFGAFWNQRVHIGTAIAAKINNRQFVEVGPNFALKQPLASEFINGTVYSLDLGGLHFQQLAGV